MKNKNTLIYIVAIFSMILSFLLIILVKGLEEFEVSGSINITKIFSDSIKSISSWILNITISIATTLFWYWSFTLRKLKLLEREEYLDRLNTFNNYVKLKSDNFIEFVKIENKSRREFAYIEHINKKISKLEMKLSKITSLGLSLKKDVKYQEKINLLKSRITPEYISEHLVWWFYNPISPSDFRYNNINSIDISDRTSSKEAAKTSITMVRKIIFSTLSSFLALSFLSTLLAKFKFSSQLWVILVAVILSLIMSVYFGFIFAEKIYKSEYIGVLDNRIEVLKKYLKYSKEHPEHTNPKLDAVYEYVEKLSEK